MRKINLGLVIGFILAIFIVNPLYAVTPKIVITDLPEYIRINDFKLSYSALTSDPSSIQVQFYYQVDGGGYSAFGSVLSGASGQVQVASGQVGQSEKKYCFKAEIIGETFSNETCTIFDQNSPDAPSGYSKEKVTPNVYRLKWRNPNNDDFSRVFIYRSDVSGFTADGSTKVGELVGTKDEEASWDNNVDPDKEYFYALRAIDKAGNASGLVGDQGVVAGEVQGESTSLEEEKAIIVPVEGETKEPEGEVLPAETEAPKTLGEKAGDIVSDVAQFAKDRTKITVGIIIGLFLIAGSAVYFFKKNK